MKNLKPKTIAAIILSFCLFSSCKKEKKIEPCSLSEQASISCRMKITINAIGSTSSSKLMGRILAISESDTVFDKELNYTYPSLFALDTMINFNASNLEVKIFALCNKSVGGNNYDYDNIADNNIKVFLNDDLKINTFGSYIAMESKIK